MEALLALLVVGPTVFFYFLIIRGSDRYEPEPIWLLSVAFFWGAVVSTLTAIVFNEVGEGAIRASLGAGQAALVDASTASFVAPLVEESSKGFGVLVLWAISALWVKEIDGALDGAIYGGVIGLGFTMTEDVLYISSAGSQHGGEAFFQTFVLRTVLAGLGHASFTAMTGLGVGIAVESSSSIIKLLAPIGGWCAAVGLHFVHNYLVTFLYDGGSGVVLKLLLFWTFDVLFFLLILTLAIRDRAIVLKGLVDEAGRLLHPKELQRTASYWMLVPTWNFFSLLGSPKGYGEARRKQLDLVELSFLKARRRRGEKGQDLDAREQELRQRIQMSNQAGVFIGAR
ncbi:MAG TPA: PrsW family intramembrane metalloprotease [Polyangiaceae bacterium]|nr:PrsW family intramembrane metalloprotease [Polyangiaceae bacterium]